MSTHLSSSIVLVYELGYLHVTWFNGKGWNIVIKRDVVKYCYYKRNMFNVFIEKNCHINVKELQQCHRFLHLKFMYIWQIFNGSFLPLVVSIIYCKSIYSYNYMIHVHVYRLTCYSSTLISNLHLKHVWFSNGIMLTVILQLE